MSDARTTPRRRCLIGARIAFNNRNSTLDCVLRDISPGGARLEHPTPFLLPDAFDLEIPAEPAPLPGAGRVAAADRLRHRVDAGGGRVSARPSGSSTSPGRRRGG